MVIAVIGVLVAITFGISTGVRNAQLRATAKAELAVIAQGLEQFKLRYGDYPWITEGSSPEANGGLLLQALLGWKEFDREGDVTTFVPKTNVPSTGPKALIDVSKLTIRKDGDDAPYVDLPSTTTSGPSGYYLADPWGNPYIYWYKRSDSPDAWNVFGYHLYSTGPNGEDANQALKANMLDPQAGVFGSNYRDVANENAIIFAGE